MVKKVSAREKVQAKLAKQKAAAENTVAAEDGQNAQSGSVGSGSAGKKGKVGVAVGKSSRGTRKIAKQVRFVQKLQASQQALAPAKTIAKKRRKRKHGKDSGHTLENLDSLAKFLPTHESLALKASSQRGPKIMHSKARQEITKEETKQLAAVLAHPAFQQNPFVAIKQHLENTLPPPPPPLAPPKEKKPKGKRKKAKQAGGKGGGGGVQTMDMS